MRGSRHRSSSRHACRRAASSAHASRRPDLGAEYDGHDGEYDGRVLRGRQLEVPPGGGMGVRVGRVPGRPGAHIRRQGEARRQDQLVEEGRHGDEVRGGGRARPSGVPWGRLAHWALCALLAGAASERRRWHGARAPSRTNTPTTEHARGGGEKKQANV